MNNPATCMIHTKSDVVFHPATWHYAEMWKIPLVVKGTAPPDYNPTITSGVEGRHCDQSFHYIGGALDWRIKDFIGSLDRWEREIQKKLGLDYYVKLEERKLHIHIHWKLMPRL